MMKLPLLKNHIPKLALIFLFLIISVVFAARIFLKFTYPKEGDTIKKIGLFLPEETRLEYLQASDLALQEINEEGGVLGEKISLKILERPSDFLITPLKSIDKILEAGKNFANDRTVLSVVAMTNGDSTQAMVPILSRKNKIIVTAAATDPLVTTSGFSNVFATQVDDRDIASVIVHHASANKIKKFLILGDESIPSKNLVSRFKAELLNRGGEVVYQYTGFTPHQAGEVERFKQIVLFILENKIFKVEDFGALLIAAGSGDAYKGSIPYLRGLNILQPIYTPSNLINSDNIEAFSTNNVEDVYAVTPYDPEFEASNTELFRKKFNYLYSRHPTQLDEQVYSALKIIAYAINNAKTSSADVVSNFLRTMRFKKPFIAPSGNISFNENGRITDTDVFVMRFEKGGFVKNARYLKPFSWEETK